MCMHPHFFIKIIYHSNRIVFIIYYLKMKALFLSTTKAKVFYAVCIGLEPMTLWLTVKCSEPTELTNHFLYKYYNIKKQFQPYCKLDVKGLPYAVFNNSTSILLGSELIVLIRRYLHILNIQHSVQSGFYNQYNLTLKPLHLPYTFIFIIRVSISFS